MPPPMIAIAEVVTKNHDTPAPGGTPAALAPLAREPMLPLARVVVVDRPTGGCQTPPIRQGAPHFGGVIGKQVEFLRGPATVAGEPTPSGA